MTESIIKEKQILIIIFLCIYLVRLNKLGPKASCVWGQGIGICHHFTTKNEALSQRSNGKTASMSSGCRCYTQKPSSEINITGIALQGFGEEGKSPFSDKRGEMVV